MHSDDMDDMAYMAGESAALRGVSRFSCPHMDFVLRESWLWGLGYRGRDREGREGLLADKADRRDEMSWRD